MYAGPAHDTPRRRPNGQCVNDLDAALGRSYLHTMFCLEVLTPAPEDSNGPFVTPFIVVIFFALHSRARAVNC